MAESETIWKRRLWSRLKGFGDYKPGVKGMEEVFICEGEIIGGPGFKPRWEWGWSWMPASEMGEEKYRWTGKFGGIWEEKKWWGEFVSPPSWDGQIQWQFGPEYSTKEGIVLGQFIHDDQIAKWASQCRAVGTPTLGKVEAGVSGVFSTEGKTLLGILRLDMQEEDLDGGEKVYAQLLAGWAEGEKFLGWEWIRTADEVAGKGVAREMELVVPEKWEEIEATIRRDLWGREI